MEVLSLLGPAGDGLRNLLKLGLAGEASGGWDGAGGSQTTCLMAGNKVCYNQWYGSAFTPPSIVTAFQDILLTCGSGGHFQPGISSSLEVWILGLSGGKCSDKAWLSDFSFLLLLDVKNI